MARAFTVGLTKQNGNHHLLGVFTQGKLVCNALAKQNLPDDTVIRSTGHKDLPFGYTQFTSRISDNGRIDLWCGDRHVGRVYRSEINTVRPMPKEITPPAADEPAPPAQGLAPNPEEVHNRIAMWWDGDRDSEETEDFCNACVERGNATEYATGEADDWEWVPAMDYYATGDLCCCACGAELTRENTGASA